MAFSNNLGIYPDAIDDVYEVCEDIIQDVREFAEKIGYIDDGRRADFNDEVMYSLEDRFNVRDITNSVISGCLETAKDILDEMQLCQDFGLTFDTYANCHDSHLYFEHNGIIEEYHGSGDMDDLLNEILAERLCDIICDRLVDSGECSKDSLTDEKIEELKDVLNTDLDRYIDDEDIVACYCEWKITGTIREAVDDVIFDNKQQTVEKPSVGRD